MLQKNARRFPFSSWSTEKIGKRFPKYKLSNGKYFYKRFFWV